MQTQEGTHEKLPSVEEVVIKNVNAEGKNAHGRHLLPGVLLRAGGFNLPSDGFPNSLPDRKELAFRNALALRNLSSLTVPPCLPSFARYAFRGKFHRTPNLLAECKASRNKEYFSRPF